MFPPTQPMDDAVQLSLPLLQDAAEDDAPMSTQLSGLNPSLLQDLMRFEQRGDQRELLEVIAACVRHTQALAIRLGWGEQELTLTVFPTDRLVHCPMPMDAFLGADLSTLQVIEVQSARLRPPGDEQPALVGNPAFYGPLAPVLWAVALAGARGDLLPELAGQAAYRVVPDLNLAGLYVPAAMAQCIQRLRRQSSNLREIADWQGIGTERAARLLNALYLQSGLIVSRSHPAATNEGWSGYR